jgi:hypothetical protein
MDIAKVSSVINAMSNRNPKVRSAILASFESSIMHFVDELECGAYMRSIAKEVIINGSTDSTAEVGGSKDNIVPNPENHV